MSIDYSLDGSRAPLELTDGVAAFDPTTLTIAAEILDTRGFTIAGDRLLDSETSPALKRLAKVSATPPGTVPVSVTAIIDTGVLRWSSETYASVDEIDAYDGTTKYGVSISRKPVLTLKDAVVTRASMTSEKLHESKVKVWFAELKGELGNTIDGFDLLSRAKNYSAQFQTSTDLQAMVVTVPAQELRYASSIPQALTCYSAPVFGILQRFAAALNEKGAHVIAETTIITSGIPTFEIREPPPPPYVFGCHGPVMMWFTEEGYDLPFSVFYTTPEAWPDLDDDVDLDSVTLMPVPV